uniref:Secreted protein n=1 Tax=Gasterosteus aculeatus aculeatus TaxID=481459 RepID=A0AAQ4RC78_GASAC
MNTTCKFVLWFPWRPCLLGALLRSDNRWTHQHLETRRSMCSDVRCLFLATAKMSASEEQEAASRDPCVNPGNPVFSCMMSAAALRAKPQHPLYRTSSREYGLRPPTAECCPCTYHPKNERFSRELFTFGMYRDNSFNTALDRSRVHDCTTLNHTI